MNFNQPPSFEQRGQARERLLSLEKEGKYVFHGSPEDIPVLEPRQAYKRNNETGEMEKDAEPAVFGTQFADIAIFRALVNTKGVDGESSSRFGINDDGTLHFSASQNLLDAAKSKVGKVYVLNKQGFIEESMQFRSVVSCAPVQVIEVGFGDLPNGIKVLE